MSSLKIIDSETREELADLGMETEAPVRACIDCRFLMDRGGPPQFWKCGARGGSYTEFLNEKSNCEHFRAMPPASTAPIPRPSRASLWISITALATSVASFFLGACSFPSEGFPSDEKPARWPWKADASESSSTGDVDGSEDGSETGGMSSGVGSSTLADPETSDDDDGSSDSGSGESSGSSDSGSSSGDSGSTGDLPGAWEQCDEWLCDDGLVCPLAVSMASCGKTGACHICSPICDSDDDCGGGSFCFEQGGYCMLSCDVGCPSGSVCLADAEPFCSFPD